MISYALIATLLVAHGAPVTMTLDSGLPEVTCRQEVASYRDKTDLKQNLGEQVVLSCEIDMVGE